VANTATGGIANQNPGNYEYDAIGNLTRDNSEGIASIGWTVYGKVDRVYKANGAEVTYLYDAAGQRAVKIAAGVLTWYVRDASGNVMAIYENNVLKELPIYGSSRLGVYRVQGGSLETDRNKLTLGRREYELANHLGNVLAVVSDAKLPAARVLSHTDYYAFGGAMPGRSGGSPYRHGFNTQERSPELAPDHYTAEFWEYDARIGRRWNLDPVVKPHESGYAAFANSPVWLVDPSGADTLNFKSVAQGLNMLQVATNELERVGGELKRYDEALSQMEGLMDGVDALSIGMTLLNPAGTPGAAYLQIRSLKDLEPIYEKVRGRRDQLAGYFAAVYKEYSQIKGELSKRMAQADALGMPDGSVMAAMVLGTAIVHGNLNSAVRTYALYEIKIGGETYKFGIADAERTRSDGTPVRLADQERQVRRWVQQNCPALKVEIYYSIEGRMSKSTMKADFEDKALESFLNKNGYIPDGNKAHADKWGKPQRGKYPSKIK
jgi:hypothetical protein